MTERVDFYVLAGAADDDRRVFACRLTEKAYLRKLRVVVLADTPSDLRRLDDLLWTFREGSFVPHAICAESDAADPGTPVYLTAAEDGGPTADLLVNLSNRLPPQLQRYARIAEIIDADADRRRRGRERFKSYRELDVAIETHKQGLASDV